MLVPKRVKHRREFRGRMRGEAKGVKKLLLANMVCKLLNLLGLQTDKLKLPVSR